MALPAIEGLVRQDPDGQVDILIHRDSAATAGVLAETVHRVHYFEREFWQKQLGESWLQSRTAHAELMQLVQSLRAEEYDAVYNFSHTYLAAELTDLIGGKVFHGVRVDIRGAACYSSPWFQDMEKGLDRPDHLKLHFVDSLMAGVGLAGSGFQRYRSRSTGTARVAIQVLTSDARKNWPAHQWVEVLRLLQTVRPQLELTLLGAPFEEEQLQSLASQLGAAGVCCELIVSDLETTKEILGRQDLLISGDTSIKHLAALQGVPVLELALGPSVIEFTGAFSDRSFIVQARAACCPCPVREGCSQSRQVCADIPPELIAMLATQVLEETEFQAAPLAEEYRKQVRVLRSVRTGDGLWHAVPVAERFSEAAVHQWVSRVFHILSLGGGDRSRVETYVDLLRQIFPLATAADWRMALEKIVVAKDRDLFKREFLECLTSTKSHRV